MAFARHNIEKRRLIELVRLNPILWDCRLPHYKRSDKKKALKWNELGRIFSVNGERVQRTFTSLREIFRRELNHEKMLGSRFKSKWEYYEEMAFLKEVIRERKSRERAKSGELAPPPPSNTNNNNNNNDSNHNNNIHLHSPGIDEYQYFAPNDPNNPHNQLQQSLQQATAQADNSTQQQQQQQQSLQPLQPDVILNLNLNPFATLEKLSTNVATGAMPSSAPTRPLSRTRSLTTRSCSSSPSIYIKDEPDSLDDTISLMATTNEKVTKAQNTTTTTTTTTASQMTTTTTTTTTTDAKEKSLEMADKSKSLHNSTQNLVIDEREEGQGSEMDDPDPDPDPDRDPDRDPDHDPDPDADPDIDMNDERFSISSTTASLAKDATTPIQPRYHPSAREVLYTKFGEFLSARLNTLNETVANDLMNRILLLIAEK